MGSISVACYKPRPGREQALLELVRNHLPPLRAEGFVTERAPIVMRCADGSIVEIFEWASQEIIVGAHKNPVALDLEAIRSRMLVRDAGQHSGVPEYVWSLRADLMSCSTDKI
jgi:hypothetical protein